MLLDHFEEEAILKGKEENQPWMKLDMKRS